MKFLATILAMILGSVVLVGCVNPDHLEWMKEDVAKATSAIESEFGGEVELSWITHFGLPESETSIRVVFVKPPTKIPDGQLRQRLTQIVHENFRVPVKIAGISINPASTLNNSAELIESLHRERIETFIYDPIERPENVRGLIDRTDNVRVLIAEYKNGNPDHVFRFNLISLLIAKAERSIDAGDKTKIIECLHQALGDPHAWVRGEAVWGLGMVGGISDIPDIIPLLSDEDEIDEERTVARVARGALVEIFTLPAYVLAAVVVIIFLLWRSYKFERSRAEPITVPEQVTLESRTIPFEFTGNAGEYFKIWIVNVALTIGTLGIYSAWAKVRRKRYLYSNTLLDGLPFEYHGDPIKILKGRLIVAGGLLIYFVTTFFLPFIEAYSWLLALMILPWLVVIARTFNARNSSYRNIRFDFRTKWREAVEVFFGVGLLGATGFGYPYFVYRRALFVVSHSRYGTTPLALYWRNMISTFYGIYLAAGGLFLALFFVNALIFFSITTFMGPHDQQNLLWSAIPFFLSMGLLVSLPTFAFLKTAITNLIWSNCAIAHHRFYSSLKGSQMIWLYVSNAIAILLSLGLLIPWATIRLVRYRLENFKFLAADDLNEFVSSQQEEVPATGEEASEFFDVDVGI